MRITGEQRKHFDTSESTGLFGMFVVWKMRGFLSVFEINFYINKIYSWIFFFRS